jgi:hypothetical protein
LSAHESFFSTFKRREKLHGDQKTHKISQRTHWR